MIQKIWLDERLKLENKDLFEKFFSESDLVFSANNVIDWWFGMWESFNNFKIKQKLPVKTYCGVIFNDTWKISLWKLYDYDWLEKSFNTFDFEDTVPNDFDKLQKFLDEKFFIDWKKWIELSFICENPRWHGFGAWDIVSLLTMFSIYYVKWNINLDLLKDYKKFINSDIANTLYYDSWTLADILMEWRSTWSDLFVSMDENSMPMIYISKNFVDSHLYESENEKDKTCHKNIFDFLGLKNDWQELPFDFWVLNFWVDYDSDYIDQVSQNYKNDINNVQNFVSDIFKKNGISDDKFYFGNLDYEHFYDNFVEVGTIFHFKLLKAFQTVLQNPLDETAINEFISIINEFWAYSIILESNNTFLTDIKSSFYSLKLFDNEKIWLCPLTLWKMWGSFLFVTPYKRSRRTISKLIEKYNCNWKKMYLEYISWIDWYSNEWIKVEQDISCNVFSDFVSEWSVLYKDNFGGKHIWDYNDILNDEKDWILFDWIEWNIYVNWIWLTSKDLASQSSTVEIMQVLLSHFWECVSSKELPYSSYSRQRNQMAGKIILPLKKMTKKYFGKEIDLDCVGWLWWFNLILNEKNIKIWVISKI